MYDGFCKIDTNGETVCALHNTPPTAVQGVVFPCFHRRVGVKDGTAGRLRQSFPFDRPRRSACDAAVNRRSLFWLLLFVGLDLAAFFYWRGRQDHRFDAQIRLASSRHGLAPALVKAVIWRESNFDPAAVGKAGEIGLMQLMDDAAHEWAGAARVAGFAHEHVFDPGTNTLAGSYYLAKLLRRYPTTDNPLPYALADYNAGRGNVLKWMTGAARTNSAAFIGQIGFPATRAYVLAITERYAKYRMEFH